LEGDTGLIYLVGFILTVIGEEAQIYTDNKRKNSESELLPRDGSQI